MFKRLARLIVGEPRNPLDQTTKKKIALSVFFAWIGLGADGLSSACYGPEQAFLSLGQHTQLAFYLAIAIAVSVFIISFAYNQVIELFPSGGGGYKVATKLLGDYPGLVAGSALIVDYILTIVISIASGVEALFSLLPLSAQSFKLEVDAVLIIILLALNLRGMKESIKILMPIFVGFVITHLALIIYGVSSHGREFPVIVNGAMQETRSLMAQTGVFFVLALFIRAYSLGGATYTGLEAVSNNVNTLAEPRVRTGKWTMFYMALSLSLTAGGIIILYLLWQVKPQPGQTLNAVVFRNILENFQATDALLLVVLLLEAGLLFVSANTGFLGGPSVLANMAIDSWVPSRFRNLSSRLVIQNGILLYGISALIILFLTRAHVMYILVLYSLNVFLAFSLCLTGLCRHWWQQRGKARLWLPRLMLSALAWIICVSIFLGILVSRFTEGGIVALLIIGAVITICILIRQHYNHVFKQLERVDHLLTDDMRMRGKPATIPVFDPKGPTAVLFVGKSLGVAMHTLLWIHRLFPGHFKNFIFVSVGVIDVESYIVQESIPSLKQSLETNLEYFVTYAQKHGYAATEVCDFGMDPVAKLTEIAEKLNRKYPECIFFASNLVVEKDNWLTRRLHNETAFSVQRRLHMQGLMMVILPMNLSAALNQ